MWITDGSISRRKDYNGFVINISQKKPDVCKKLEDTLNNLGLKFSAYRNNYKISSPSLGRWLYKEFIRGEDFRKSYYVRIPRTILIGGSYTQLNALLMGLMDGDGSHNKKTEFLYSASHGLMDDVQELLLYIGKCGTIHATTNRVGTTHILNGNIVKTNVPTYTTTICKSNEIYIRPHHSKTKYKNQLSIEHYSGNVCCVELPKHHKLYVRRNGLPLWCGNCSHELVRHRVFSFSQESTRYVNSTKRGFEFVKPYWWKDGVLINPLVAKDEVNTIKLMDIFKNACQDAADYYTTMIEMGMTPQQARAVLPNATKTELAMTGTIPQWEEFLKLRTDKAAHPDMQIIANKIKELLY